MASYRQLLSHKNTMQKRWPLNPLDSVLANRPHYSLIETCKANGVDPYRYLVALFKALPLAKTADDYEQLLPWHLSLGN